MDAANAILGISLYADYVSVAYQTAMSQESLMSNSVFQKSIVELEKVKNYETSTSYLGF
jgi:hypothetical protein